MSIRKQVNNVKPKRYRVVSSLKGDKGGIKYPSSRRIPPKPFYVVNLDNISFEDLIGITRVLSARKNGKSTRVSFKNKESNVLLQQITNSPPEVKAKLEDSIVVEIVKRNEHIHSPTKKTKVLFNKLKHETLD